MAVLLLPVVLAVSASQPVAVLEPPLVLFIREKYPVPVLELPVALKTSESVPTAVFCAPLVLSKSAATPTAVLELPLLSASAPPPTPVLKLPVVFKNSDRQPSAVLPAPVARELSASHPSAVVKFGSQPSGGGLIARAPGKNARQANTGRTATNIVFLVFIFFSFICCFSCPSTLPQGTACLSTTTLAAGLRISIWAFTLWICVACSFTWAVSPSICFWFCVTVVCTLSIMRLSMACLVASGMAWGRMLPLGENPPGSCPSAVVVLSRPSESIITTAAVAAETGVPKMLSIKHLSLSWPNTLCTPG